MQAASLLKPPPRASGQADEAPLSDEERARRIKTLDPTERKVGTIGAIVAAVAAVATTLPYVANPNTPIRHAAGKNHSCTAPFKYVASIHECSVVYPRSHWVEVLLLMLVFALAIFVSVRIGRRSALGFTALLTGLAYETQVGILGLPFLAGGGWLLIRSWRVQRYGTPTAKGAARASRTAGSSTAASTQKAGSATRASGQAATTGPRRAPGPNKRYTPKAAPKKRAQPTRSSR